MLPREGHLKAVKRILTYLKTFPKGRDIIDTSYPDHSMRPVEDHSYWVVFYPDAGEEIPKDPKGRVIIDTSYPDHSMHPVEDHSYWVEFYPDAGEEIPKNLRPEKGPRVRIIVYVDTDHAHDLVTRRSITVILVMINNTPIRWISKRQKKMETSTYGSELVASRIATEAELILEVRYILRSLGATLDELALMLGDNMSVVLNTTVPSSVLKKKHNAIVYH
jgi:hypothetical protein